MEGLPDVGFFETEGDFEIGLGVAGTPNKIGIHFQSGFGGISAAAVGRFSERFSLMVFWARAFHFISVRALW